MPPVLDFGLGPVVKDNERYAQRGRKADSAIASHPGPVRSMMQLRVVAYRTPWTTTASGGMVAGTNPIACLFSACLFGNSVHVQVNDQRRPGSTLNGPYHRPGTARLR